MEEENAATYGDVLDDDVLDKENEGPWFAMGISKEEKLKARRP